MQIIVYDCYTQLEENIIQQIVLRYKMTCHM